MLMWYSIQETTIVVVLTKGGKILWQTKQI